MHSSLISKIEKARIYAAEPERISLEAFSCRVRGDNDSHTVSLQDGRLRCDCYFHRDHSTCSHTMALQRLMCVMLPEGLRPASPAA